MSGINKEKHDMSEPDGSDTDMTEVNSAESDMIQSIMVKPDTAESTVSKLDMPEPNVPKPDRMTTQPSNPPLTWNYYHRTDNWMSERFVESAGCILFHLSTSQICIIRSRQSGEYLLPKGRCNLGECRQDAALREAQEETGYTAYLLPITMFTRATPPIETASFSEDKPRIFEALCEPITMQLRYLGTAGVQVIWWFVAAIDEDIEACQDSRDQEMYEPVLLGYNEVLGKLTWPNDREIVYRALDLVEHQAHLDDLSNVELPVIFKGGSGSGTVVNEVA